MKVIFNNNDLFTLSAVADGSCGSCLKALGGGACVACSNLRLTSPAPTASVSLEPQDDADCAETHDMADIADTCQI